MQTDDAAGGPAPGPDAGGISDPAKLLRVIDMTRQMLDELHYDGLDEAARTLVHRNYSESLQQVRLLLPDGDRRELDQLLASLQADAMGPQAAEDGPPSGIELRLAEAQLLGWLEGLLKGIETDEALRQVGVELEQALRRQPPPSSLPDKGHGGYA